MKSTSKGASRPTRTGTPKRGDRYHRILSAMRYFSVMVGDTGVVWLINAELAVTRPAGAQA